MEERNAGREFTVAAHELLDTIKGLIAKGNARSLIIRNESGRKLLEIPLTAGVAIGGAAVFLAPFLAAIAAIAGLATKVKVEVVPRDGEPRAGEDDPGGPADPKDWRSGGF